MTEEHLTKAEDWAGLPFGINELADLLQVTPARLRIAIADATNPLGIAVRRGRLQAKADLYEKVTQLAQQGSGPAQLLLGELFKRNEL